MVPTLLVVAFFSMLTLVMLYPLSRFPTTHIRDLGDPLLNAWILAWVSRNLFTDPLSLFHANIFHPFPYSLAFSEVQVAAVPIAGPVLWLTGNPILAHNILAITSFFLCAICAYLLGRHLTNSIAAGIVAGVIFAFAPIRIGQLGHVQLLNAHWMPIALLFLHRAQVDRRWTSFLAFAACFTLQTLSSFYLAFFLSLAVGLYLIYAAIFQRHTIGTDLVRKLIVVGALSGVAILPFTVPYLRARAEYGPEFSRTFAEVKRFSATFGNYLAAPADNVLYRRLPNVFIGPEASPDRGFPLFPGLLPGLLAVAGSMGIARGLCRRAAPAPTQEEASRESGAASAGESGAAPVRGYYVLLTGFGFVMSLGPTLRVSGTDTGVPLPYHFFYDFLPGFSALRVPLRFGILVQLGIAVLAGYGVVTVMTLLRRRRVGRLARAASVIALTGIVVVEYGSFPLRTSPVPTGPDVPEVYRWLAEQPPNAAVIELPIGTLLHDYRYVYFSTYHWRRIVNGVSGFFPREYDAIVQEMRGFQADGAIDLLRGLGVGLVIVHADAYPSGVFIDGDLYPTGSWPDLERRLATSPGLSHVRSFGNDHVYRVAPRE